MYSKYNAKKCRCLQGHIHDSKKEARRCNELSWLECAGEVSDLQQQVKYVLIPAQYAVSTEKYTKGKHKGEYKRGKLIEKECAYYADFVYTTKDGRTIVEDTKGVKTSEYKIKKKLMLYVHGISIHEI